MVDLPPAGPPADAGEPAPHAAAAPHPDRAAPDLPDETRRALEAIVMVAADPVPPQMLAQLLEVAVERVEAACAVLADEYEAQDRGFVMVRVAGGYRFQSHPEAAPYVERYVLEGQSARLSSAALETLAIVAYKQPLSRAQVASIRGVNVDGVMRTLTHRGLVAEVARDPGPGQAVLYGTTALFLERLGLDALDDLPPIAAFVPGADVVEALEHSLRIDPDDPPTLPGTEDPSDLDAPEPPPAGVHAPPLDDDEDPEPDDEPEPEPDDEPEPAPAEPAPAPDDEPEPAPAEPAPAPDESAVVVDGPEVDLTLLGDAQDWESTDDEDDDERP